jgi:23S rRNA (uridine2552-2'-O)-methyltransferase
MSKPRRSSGSWRDRQERDPYVQQARRDGWRSRAVYKLEQICEKERFLKPGMVCVDLGSAPGSWSQYVTEKLKGKARIVAVDVLPMDSLPDVEFIQGDFREDEVFEQLLQSVGEDGADSGGSAALDVPGRVSAGYGPAGTEARRELRLQGLPGRRVR